MLKDNFFFHLKRIVSEISYRLRVYNIIKCLFLLPTLLSDGKLNRQVIR